MLSRFTVGGIATLVAIVAATMVAAVSPTEAAPRCTRTCQWKCDGVGAFGRCAGKWYRQCSEWRCHRKTG